jgi:acyl dehydratase
VRDFASPQELLAAVGTDLGYSQWHQVTQDHIDAFAQATGDHQWIHTDPQRAAAGPFGGTIAHGYLTLSLLPMLKWELMTVRSGMAVNYGVNKVRFPAPVPVGSWLRAHVVITDATETPAGVLVVTQVTVEVRDSSKPVCVAETLTLYRT